MGLFVFDFAVFNIAILQLPDKAFDLLANMIKSGVFASCLIL